MKTRCYCGKGKPMMLEYGWKKRMVSIWLDQVIAKSNHLSR